MPDFADLIDLDFGGGGSDDWMDMVFNLGADAGDMGNLVFDTLTGDFVDASTIDPSELADLGPVPNVLGGPTGTSLSDTLRSRAADPMTAGTEPFDWNAMADPSASIASAGGGDWLKALGQGLANALSGFGSGSGLSGLAGNKVPSVGGGDLPGMMGNSILPLSAAGQAREFGLPATAGQAEALGAGQALRAEGGGGLQGLAQPGMQDAISAALVRLQQAEAGQRLPLQPGVDPGPPPVKFTPLTLPGAAGGIPMAAQAPRVSGLQRLLAERLG